MKRKTRARAEARRWNRRNRILAAALGFVATTGACGAFGNRALFSDETSSGARPIVVEPKGGELAKPSACKAFLVAADNYGSRAAALPGAKNDVEALAERLEELGFDVVVLKTNDDYENLPQKSVIEAEYAEFVSRLRKGDFALVFLSGHGIQKTSTGEAFFAPIDVKTESAERLFATSVSIREMMTKLEKSAATFRWMIVDACREDPTQTGSESAFETATTERSFAGAAKSLGQVSDLPQALALLQSCQPNKISYEGPVGADGKRRGFFTTSLLEALDRQNPKADANGDGALSFYELSEYVSRRTNELAEASGKEQKPNLTGSITNFALLTDLLKDGLPLSEWNKADELYREACVFRGQRKWRDALTKIKKAREINKARKEYETAEAEIQAWVDSLAVGEANALYQEAVNALLADDLATAKSKCEASLKAFETDAAQTLLKTINDKIAAASRPKPDPEPPTPPRTTVTQPPRQVAQNGGSPSGRTSTSGTGTTSSTPSVGSSSGRPSSASSEVAWDSQPTAGTLKSLTVDGITYNFRYCPAGMFTMGSPTSESGRDSDETQHEVTLDGFWMLETEVTQEMWKSLMRSNPSYFSSSESGSSKVSGLYTSQFPVERVSWDECQEFIERLNAAADLPEGFKLRLPSEAEWEYACRAKTTGPYAGSSLDSLGWYSGNSEGRTHEVGTKTANAWGLHDMHGNVWEWCEDWYDRDYYEKTNNARKPINTTENSRRVLRGGCWCDSAKSCRSARRRLNVPASRFIFIGFRLALVRSSASRIERNVEPFDGLLALGRPSASN